MSSAILQRPKWLSVKEVALHLGIHEQSVRRKIAAGEIPALQLGGPGCALRVLEDELERWLYRDRFLEPVDVSVDGSPAGGSFAGADPVERRGTQKPGKSSPPAHAGLTRESDESR
jgi:excisionase family DNA binding protein